MAGKPTKRPKLRTARVVEMAEFAGVSEQALRKWMAIPGFPASPDGSVCLWDLAVWRHNYEHGSPDDDGSELPEGSSPALERFREERARLAELQRREKERELFPIEWVNSHMGRVSGLIRQAGERIQRQCGPEAFQILDDLIQDFERETMPDDD